MAIPYFKQYKWQNLTRDERFFCAVLYSHAIKDPKDFAKWVIESAKKSSPTVVWDGDWDGDWDVGYEVCFYRDYMWQHGRSIKKENKENKKDGKECYPQKRTFDLCLFGQKSIIIIEAKVFESFDTKQNKDFEKDERHIKKVLGLENIEVHIVALASSRYFENSHNDTLKVFKGKHITWKQAEEKYKDPIFDRANKLYKSDDRMLEQQKSNIA